MELFTQLHHEGATLIMVTHEQEVADYAKRIVTVRDGEIIKDRGHEYVVPR